MTLTEIKYNISQYHGVQCKLYHEKVEMEGLEDQIKTNNLSVEPVFPRVELCPLNVRAHRIGCAHTHANDSFTELLESVVPEDNKISKLKDEFEKIVFQIYMTDLNKGELEKNLAILFMSQDSDNTDIDHIKVEIRRTEEIHCHFISEISRIKGLIIHRLEEMVIEENYN